MNTIIDLNQTPSFAKATEGGHSGIDRDFRGPSILTESTFAKASEESLSSEALVKEGRAPVPFDPRIRFGAGGGVYRIVTTAEDSLGRLFAFEATEPPGGGPPLHTHANEDEYFLVLKGEISFYIGGRVIVAKAGESAFVPRGVAHCFKNCSTRESRLLVLFTPGNVEGFFDFGLPVNGQVPSDEHLINRMTELGPKYGLEMLGPSPL